MSVFDVQSTVIANRDASPAVRTNPEKSKGMLKAVIGIQNTGDEGSDLGDAGTTIRCISVPSNARIHSMEYAAGDLGTSSLDIAVWYPTDLPQGGQNSVAASSESALISSSAFATAIAGVDTSIAFTNAFGANANPLINRYELPLWELLGLANDPEVDLDLGFSIRTAVVQNGYVGLRATYVD